MDVVYDIRWCPSHSSIFAAVDGSGRMELWNVDSPDESIKRVEVSSHALNRLKWSLDGKKIVTGDFAGCLYVYDTSKVC